MPIASTSPRQEKEQASQQIHDLGIHPLHALNLGLYRASLMNFFMDVFEREFKLEAQRAAEDRAAGTLQ